MNVARFGATLLVCLIAVAPFGCATYRFGRWRGMQTRQLVVPLGPGATVVEVRDTAHGWTERVVVHGTGGDVAPQMIALDPRVALDPEAVAFYRSEVAISPAATRVFDRAVALRDWVTERAFRAQGASGDEDAEGGRREKAVESTDGRAVLASVDAGARLNCQSVATIYFDVARAFGLTARRVDLSVRRQSPLEGHAVVEIWCDELSHWVLLDPFLAAHYEIEGRPASALDLHRAFQSRRFDALRIVRSRNATGVDPWTYRINPIQYFRNISLQTPSGSWLVYADDLADVGPVANPGFFLTTTDTAFREPPEALGAEPVFSATLGGRVTYQTLNSMLCVSVAEESFRFGSFEIRTLEGADEGRFSPDAVGYSPDDDVLCRKRELIDNGSMADANGDGLPDGWTMNGTPAVAVREGNRFVVETGETGVELLAPIHSSDGDILVVSGLLGVDRGQCTFGVQGRRLQAAATITPGPVHCASPILMRARTDDRVRLSLKHQTRCVIEWISVRQGRTFGEFAPEKGVDSPGGAL